MTLLMDGNREFRKGNYETALTLYETALKESPWLRDIIAFNVEIANRKVAIRNNVESIVSAPGGAQKLPKTALIISWDVGHNCLGRAYMLAEVVRRVCRTTVLAGFSFSKYGHDVWEPVREADIPVVSLPGYDASKLLSSLDRLVADFAPDVVIACKPRLPSIALGLAFREKLGCPLIVDVDDHELSFFKEQTGLALEKIFQLPRGSWAGVCEPYAEPWTRLAHGMVSEADDLLVSNVALKEEFGGHLVPHVRDEQVFDPELYDKRTIRGKYQIPLDAKIILFFGTARIHKGVGLLASAVAEIPDENFKLVVVGTVDKAVSSQLEKAARDRVICLPGQKFSAIPEILAMADLVCLVQDVNHAVSQFQLPAKAIDAVAMGIPLLVSETPPLLQLVKDGVAELVELKNLPQKILEVVLRESRQHERIRHRGAFLAKYSYASAEKRIRRIIKDNLARRRVRSDLKTTEIVRAVDHLLGSGEQFKADSSSGLDVVVFWKQNDTTLYGRRHDMVIRYLSSRPDVRKVVVFDAPISDYEMNRLSEGMSATNHNRFIYIRTYQKVFGVLDDSKISYNTYVFPSGRYTFNTVGDSRAHVSEGYLPYVSTVLKREGVDPHNSVFWIYPKNYLASNLISQFKPIYLVADVVDDHRAWPGISEEEKHRLTENYREILFSADMVFVNCESMRNSMSEFRTDVRLVPNGCDDSLLSNGRTEHASGRPIIVFVGNLEKKIDIPLLHKLATRFVECDIVLIGSTHSNPQINELSVHDNIKFVGVVPYAEVGGWLSRANVAIIPHRNSALTESMNPLKLYVYLAWSLPIVSTNIKNIDSHSGLVRVAHTHEEFMDEVGRALDEGVSDLDKIRAYVESNSWKSRFECHVDEILEVAQGRKLNYAARRIGV